MSSEVRVALVGGPMYDHLYGMFGDRVEVVVRADHPTLNRTVAAMLADGERIDVLATHSKYAPSQARWLMPLDDLVDGGSVAALAPLAVDLCRHRGALLCVPRLIDVRVMWMRADRGLTVPASWSDLLASDVRFGFPGRESGLFGTFFELVVGAGGRVFTDEGLPCFASPEAEWAVETLVALSARCPADQPDWHYDQVDAALLAGRVDAAGVWPGGAGPIARSPLVPVLRPHRYPAGDQRWVSYAGCHAWAVPTTCADVPAAVDLIHRLAGSVAHALDASGGNVCAHVGAFASTEPAGDIDRERRAILADTIDQAMITYPPHERFPEVEDAGWGLLHDAIRGGRDAHTTVEQIQRAAEAVLIA